VLAFALGLRSRAARIFIGSFRLVYSGLTPFYRHQLGAQGRGGAILVLWSAMRAGAGDRHRVPVVLFPHRGDVATGLATVAPELEDVWRSLGASKLDILLQGGTAELDALFLRVG